MGGLILLFSSCLFLFFLFVFYYFFNIFYPSRNGEITLLFTDIWVNHALVTNFDVGNTFLTLFAYIYEFTVMYVVTEVLYMCLIHVKGINNNKKNNKKKKKDMKRIIKSDPPPPTKNGKN